MIFSKLDACVGGKKTNNPPCYKAISILVSIPSYTKKSAIKIVVF